MSRAAISCCRLTKVYPPDTVAVDGIDLEVREGECFGLLGPNGAGKTTTIEILEGLLEPTSGEVTVLGRQWKGERSELRQQIGISLQETRFSEQLSVRETVTLFRSFYRDGFDPDDIVERVGLREKAGARVGKLSGGQRQRLEIACALVGLPSLLFLDEPTTGLDPRSRRRLWDILLEQRSEGRTIILTTHYMDEAERLCDRVAIVDRGRIISLGTPQDLIASLGGDHMIEFDVAVASDGDGVGDRDGGRDSSTAGAGVGVGAGAGGRGESAAAAGAATGAGRGGGSCPDSAVSAEALAALPGVREVRSSRRTTALTVSQPHLTVPPLLEHLRHSGRVLTRLTTRHASLEDVFVKLTGRHLDESHE